MEKKSKTALILLFVLTVILYGIQFSFYLLGQFEGKVFGYMFFFLTFASVVFMIVNVVYAIVEGIVKAGKNNVIKGNAIAVFIIKLVLIPFYILNFGIWLLITMGFLVVPGLQIFLGIIAVAVVWTYGVLLSTSVYGSFVIGNLCKNKKIPVSVAVILIILQFIFVTDIISYMIFYLVKRKEL